MQFHDKKKRAATIVNVSYGVEDHGMLTCHVYLSMDDGAHQAFGGLDLQGNQGPDFVQSICKLFNVQDLEDAIGKRCYALCSFGYLNETIEGLENESGNRFTITSFSKKYDATVQSRLEREMQSRLLTIESLKSRLRREADMLISLKNQYTDWG